MRVLITGAGSIGRELATNLLKEEDNEIVFIDTDEKKCDRVSEEFEALVINGDASNPEMLTKAQIDDADALVALTDSDPLNTVIAMLGHRFEVKKIIVKLNDLSLRSACEEIGVDKIVTPKVSAAAEIFSTLFGLERENLSILVKGGLRVVTLAIGNKKINKLEDIDLPEGAHILAVKSNSDVKIPKKGIKLNNKDEIIFLIEDKKILDELKEKLEKDKQK